MAAATGSLAYLLKIKPRFLRPAKQPHGPEASGEKREGSRKRASFFEQEVWAGCGFQLVSGANKRKLPGLRCPFVGDQTDASGDWSAHI
jgi:hypothetical protein